MLTAATIDLEPGSNQEVDRVINLAKEWQSLPPIAGQVFVVTDEIRFASTLLDITIRDLGGWGKKRDDLGDGALLCVDTAQTRMYKWIGLM